MDGVELKGLMGALGGAGDFLSNSKGKKGKRGGGGGGGGKGKGKSKGKGSGGYSGGNWDIGSYAEEAPLNPVWSWGVQLY